MHYRQPRSSAMDIRQQFQRSLWKLGYCIQACMGQSKIACRNMFWRTRAKTWALHEYDSSNSRYDVARGNGTEFAAFKARRRTAACSYEAPSDPHHIRECPSSLETSLETLTSISCTDGEDLSLLSRNDFQDYHAILRKQSKWMADYRISFTLSCWKWKTRPKWRYDGKSPETPLSTFMLM